jgi:hypothetical protein
MSIHDTKAQDIKSPEHNQPVNGEKAIAMQDNRPGFAFQGKFAPSAHSQNYLADNRPIQKKANNTGLPNQLKANIENLSGHSLDDVNVHYNSAKPAQLQALAYAQGTDIHIASGQEKHLPHEAWHVVQQKQGRVKPTLQMKGEISVNDDAGLEKEADTMGAKALQLKANEGNNSFASIYFQQGTTDKSTIQRAVGFEYELDGTEVAPKYSAGKKKVFGLFGGEVPQPLVTLKKGYVIADYDTFDVSVDSTPGGGFDVEFRIKPVDHTSPAALKGLQETLLCVLVMLNKLQRRNQPIPGDYIPNGDPNVLITGDFESGTLQATAGLSLEALYSFLSGEMGSVFEQAHDDDFKKVKETEEEEHPHKEDMALAAKAQYLRHYGKGSPTIFNIAVGYVNHTYPDILPGERKQVAAVISSLLTIPLTARSGPVSYAKSATTLLARSDYATVFNALPAAVLANKGQLKFLIMETLNASLVHFNKNKEDHGPQADYKEAGLNSRIYPEGSIKDSTGLSLTIGEWLDGLLSEVAAPKDLLTDTNYPRGKYPHDDTEQLESLGGYGDRTDQGEDDQRLPIFEFRKRLTIPLGFLPHTIEGIWTLINEANKNRNE